MTSSPRSLGGTLVRQILLLRSVLRQKDLFVLTLSVGDAELFLGVLIRTSPRPEGISRPAQRPRRQTGLIPALPVHHLPAARWHHTTSLGAALCDAAGGAL